MTINNAVTPLTIFFYTFLFQSIKQNYLVFVFIDLIALAYMLLILPRIFRFFREENIS
ncbi:major facilitator superfamily protein [Lacticaseibacillus paracasei subsp. paracasei Lpp48]|nr:major facilitator superfamily protein [Lacticaseibacillus paracasei subsp. paracasei Lpp48]